MIKASRLGYSIGIKYPPGWGEYSTSLRPDNKTVLQENIPSHLVPDFGTMIGELKFHNTNSTGNHGKAGAYLANLLKTEVTICVSEQTTIQKTVTLKNKIALVLTGNSIDDETYS